MGGIQDAKCEKSQIADWCYFLYANSQNHNKPPNAHLDTHDAYIGESTMKIGSLILVLHIMIYLIFKM